MKTVRIERLFGYTREQVFDAWTRPELLVRWFAPKGCTIRFEYIDVRAGGGFHSCLHNPKFGDCRTVAEFREVLRPERLVFDWRVVGGQEHDPEWPAETRVVVTFDAHEGGTRMTLTQNVSEALARRTGAYPSWLQMLEQLESLLVHAVRQLAMTT